MRTQHPRFTKSEDEFLRTHCDSMSRRNMAERLGRSVRAIESRCRKLQLRKFQMRAFSKKEDRIILAAKGRTSVEIARLLGRSAAVIRMRAVRLGIKSWKQFSPIKDVKGYKVSHYRLGKGKYQRVMQHRRVMEEQLGRELADCERVHHINCIKRDNRIENLYLCASPIEHIKIHAGLESLIAELLARGCIQFDRSKGIYQLCEIHKH